MFSWICPQCGRDVPPSKTDCPYCEERQREIAAQQAANPPAPQQAPASQQPAETMQQSPTAYSTGPSNPAPAQPRQENGAQPASMAFAPPYAGGPPQQPAYGQPSYGQTPQYGQQQQYPQQPQYGQHGAWGAPPPKRSLPTWALSLIFAVAILGVGAAVYVGLQRYGKTNPQEKAGLENPANPSKARVTNPLQKYVEVVGIRLMTDKKKPAARFIVVNHSTGSIDGLTANVTLWASTSRSEEDSVASFAFRLPHLGPSESRELTEPLKTKLKIYELPDWQNANADIQITAP